MLWHFFRVTRVRPCSVHYVAVTSSRITSRIHQLIHLGCCREIHEFGFQVSSFFFLPQLVIIGGICVIEVGVDFEASFKRQLPASSGVAVKGGGATTTSVFLRGFHPAPEVLDLREERKVRRRKREGGVVGEEENKAGVAKKEMRQKKTRRSRRSKERKVNMGETKKGTK